MSGNFDIIEAVWIFVALVGVIFQSLLVYDTHWRDERVPGLSTGAQMLAHDACLRESLVGIVQSLFLTVGIAAAFAPAPPAQTRRIGLIILLILGQAILVLSSILSRQSKIRVLRYFEELENGAGNGSGENRVSV